MNLLCLLGAVSQDMNFWFFLLVVLMVIFKDTRYTGFILLMTYIIVGGLNLVIFISICGIWALTWYLNPQQLYEHKYKKKMKELNDHYNETCKQCSYRKQYEDDKDDEIHHDGLVFIDLDKE